MNTTKSDYQQQALEFLKKHNIHMTIELADVQKPAPWTGKGEQCGKRYWIRLFKGLAGATMTFPFWGSIADKEKGVDPTEYDVLACMSGSIHCPETFEEFCSEYGYDTDSRSAEDSFHNCNSIAKDWRALLGQSAIDDLAEIN